MRYYYIVINYIIIWAAMGRPGMVYGQAAPAHRPSSDFFRSKAKEIDGRTPLLETVPEVSSSQVTAMFARELSEKRSADDLGEEFATSVGVLDKEAIGSRWSSRRPQSSTDARARVQAETPSRTVRRANDVVTRRGRRLGNAGNTFSARLALSGMNVSVLNQPNYSAGQDGTGVLDPSDYSRDIRLLRARVTGSVERIAGSYFFAHVDAEFRPRLEGDGRFDSQRLNGAVVGWGLMDGRAGVRDGPKIGVALGRLAVREAGFASADGLVLRVRPVAGFDLGFFGGVTGNPYGANWRERIDESFSTNWVTGGGFSRIARGVFQASLAGVFTAATSSTESTSSGVERVYVHADIGWQPHPVVSVFATGYFDLLPGGQQLQNGDIGITWGPGLLRVRASVGRWSTLFYEGAIEGGADIDPLGNRFGSPTDGTNVDRSIINEASKAITPFDAAIQVASYYNARLSAAYRFSQVVEAYLRVNTMIRDTGSSRSALAFLDVPEADSDDVARFSPLRVLPAIGLYIREPTILDINGELVLIEDEQSVTDLVMRLGLGRAWGGLYTSVDGRLFLGEIDGYDGGLRLVYTFPLQIAIGTIQMSASVRYFRENGLDLLDFEGGDRNQVQVLSTQETLLGFVGFEWRL